MKKNIKLFEKDEITRTDVANKTVMKLDKKLKPYWKQMKKEGFTHWQIELLMHQTVYYRSAIEAFDD